MNLLLKNVRINDPSSSLHGKNTDVLVNNGIIQETGNGLTAPAETVVVEEAGVEVSPGWLDLRAFFREPGDEQKETIRSGQKAAAQGGFTGVVVMPSTHPAIQTHADVSFIKARATGYPVDVFPGGALTEQLEGKELAGMYDMKLAGAVAFTDVKRAIGNSGVMLRALQYAGNLGAPVISYADDPGLTAKLQATESPFTTLLGFKGAPAIAEEIAVQRDLSLVKYAGVPIHISGISTRDAVNRIREAKKEGVPVTAEVYVYHLLLDDTSLEGFSSMYKVKPPLRTADDVLALREAVIDGTIDVICSDHSPEDLESKDVEFDYAAYGMISLESFYGVLNAAFKGSLSRERMYEVLVKNPRRILGIDVPSITKGAIANLTVYHPATAWTFGKEHIQSKSSNTPFTGTTFKGKPIGIYNQGEWVPTGL
ncbi:MAG: dihydroorotase [Bacteroidia bacterium]